MAPKRRSVATSKDAAKSTTAKDTISARSTSLPTGDKLNMLHQRDLTWQTGTPLVHREHYVPQDDATYYRGGKVFRVLINGQQEDVMVCAGCYYCQNGKEPVGKLKLTEQELAAQAANSPTQGLPFVHTNDIGVDRENYEQPKRFLGTARNWRPDYPAMMKTTITFTRGNVMLRDVPTMQCIFDTCEICNPGTDMDDLFASWQPGGAEYERDKAEKAKYEQKRKEYVASMEAELEAGKAGKAGAAKTKAKVKKEVKKEGKDGKN